MLDFFFTSYFLTLFVYVVDGQQCTMANRDFSLTTGRNTDEIGQSESEQ